MPEHLDIEDCPPLRRIWIDRPKVRNALRPGLVAELRQAFETAASAPGVRAVVLGGRGPAFSAGADLGWMREAAGYSDAENRADAAALADMLASVRRCPRPVVARVHGPAVGGGVGLVAACDMAVAAEGAWFQLSEVRLGLVPAVILPYVTEALGPRRTRQAMLSAERFGARDAAAWGLVNETVSQDALDARIDALAAGVCRGGPDAVAAAKALADRIGGRPVDASVRAETADRIAQIRATDEAKEGMAAFFERRPPRWTGP